MKKGFIISLIVFTVQLSTATFFQAHAEEISISGNGPESSNTITNDSVSSQAVQQSNTLQINNDLSLISNTGSNIISENNKASSITSGDTRSTIDITNQGNTSTVTPSCCPQNNPSSTIISGNGSGSNNSVNTSGGTTNSILVANNAVVTTSIHGTANTGDNLASGNIGNVSIKTGDITIAQRVATGPLTISSISLPSEHSFGETSVLSNNGSNSKNAVSYFVKNENNIFVNNASTILNDVSWKLRTGANNASENVGNVDILTGNIITNADIIQGPINVNSLVTLCCLEKTGEKTPPPPNNNIGGPSTPGIGGGPSNPTNTGQILSTTTSRILPVTGNSWLFFATIGNILLLMLGVGVRLRSGRSPNIPSSL